MVVNIFSDVLGLFMAPMDAVLLAIWSVLALGTWAAAPLLPPFLRIAASAYLGVELLFFLFGKYRYEILNRVITRYPDPERVKTAMDRFLELNAIFRLEDFLSGWFLGTTADKIPKKNIEEFVAYGFFCRRIEELPPDSMRLVKEFIAQVEKRWEVAFPAGFDPSLRYMAHVWEPLRVHHKPLIMYAFTELAARTAQALLWLMGYSSTRLGPFLAWTWHPNLITSESSLLSTPHGSPAVHMGSAGSGRGRSGRYSDAVHHATEAAHSAAEHALDAAVAATSTAAATVSQQYPHENQQYHLPPTLPSSPMRDGHNAPRDSVTSIENDHDTFLTATTPFATYASSKYDNTFVDNGNTALGKSGLKTNVFHQTRGGVPIVFLHGVGFGVLPYLHFVKSIMRACPESPIVVIEMPHVALRLCMEALPVDDVAAAAIASVRRLGASRACFIGHSYGTFCVSRIVQLHPDEVHSVALLDPVCLMTCYPQLLHNFIYRALSIEAFTSIAAMFDGARFICSRDLTISHAFCRKFHWSELMLWPDDLPTKEDHTLVVLSGGDDLVPAELVQAQFEAAGHPAKILFHPKLGHGGLLLDKAWRMDVVEAISTLVMRKGRKAS